jgi:hypothetical protein
MTSRSSVHRGSFNLVWSPWGAPSAARAPWMDASRLLGWRSSAPHEAAWEAHRDSVGAGDVPS